MVKNNSENIGTYPWVMLVSTTQRIPVHHFYSLYEFRAFWVKTGLIWGLRDVRNLVSKVLGQTCFCCVSSSERCAGGSRLLHQAEYCHGLSKQGKLILCNKVGWKSGFYYRCLWRPRVWEISSLHHLNFLQPKPSKNEGRYHYKHWSVSCLDTDCSSHFSVQ